MYRVVGAMSGTSMDGLDLCLCSFTKENKIWDFKINKTKTLPYTTEWKNKLSTASALSSADLHLLDINYGKFIANAILNFIGSNKVDLICSHGHTIFHQPENSFTLQIGNGQAVSTFTGIKTVANFRALDVLLEGQGAPLVPIGDQLLFSKYQACINLGGFSNISFDKNGNRLAFDICPVNIVLNLLSQRIDMEYDENGEIAKSGKIDPSLLHLLHENKFYQKPPPKSLGREWLEENVIPTLNLSKNSIPDLLRTYTEHIAILISSVLNTEDQINDVLITGGGAKNHFLMDRIKTHTRCQIHIPNEELVDFKEALIFGLLGVLRYERNINTLQSVTGALRSSSGGVLYHPS